MRLLFGAVLSLSVASSAYALDPQKCFKTTHGSGLLRKYDYPGYSSSEYMTKKYGSFEGMSQYSSQSSTSSVDPGVTTGRFSSTSEFTSSDGGCSYFSYNREMLKDYLVRYRALVLDQAATGHGEHLKSLYFYSSCGDGGLVEFQRGLQQRFGALSATQKPDDMIAEMDAVIATSPALSAVCARG
jgi:hypothetical protein